MKLKQAHYFFTIFKKMFPKELSNLIQENDSVCDIGCGLGNFTNSLRSLFRGAEIFGLDYSQSAINYAKEHYPYVSFINEDYKKLAQDFDVIVSSNTLEHFSNPDEVLTELLKHCRKMCVILVPFMEEELYSEHLYSFSASFFQPKREGFELVYFKAIDLSDKLTTMWFGYQAMAIYCKTDECQSFKSIQFEPEMKKTFLSYLIRQFNLLKRNVYRHIRKHLIRKKPV